MHWNLRGRIALDAALLSGGTPGEVTFHPGVPRSPGGAKQVPTFGEQRDVETGANRGGILSAMNTGCLLGYVSICIVRIVAPYQA